MQIYADYNPFCQNQQMKAVLSTKYVVFPCNKMKQSQVHFCYFENNPLQNLQLLQFEDQYAVFVIQTPRYLLSTVLLELKNDFSACSLASKKSKNFGPGTENEGDEDCVDMSALIQNIYMHLHSVKQALQHKIAQSGRQKVCYQ